MAKIEDKFAGLYPVFIDKVKALLAQAEANGLKVGLYSGYRSIAQQNEILARKTGSTKARGGLSWHNYGLAVDIIFQDKTGAWTWDAKCQWQDLGKIGKSIGLDWGGDWKSLKDMGHFDWHPGLTIRAAEALWKVGFMKAVWDKLPAK